MIGKLVLCLFMAVCCAGFFACAGGIVWAFSWLATGVTLDLVLILKGGFLAGTVCGALLIARGWMR
ncbi:MAG: hypothetical protein AB7E47_03170 [Desulfovibrionaceae bacterium]